MLGSNAKRWVSLAPLLIGSEQTTKTAELKTHLTQFIGSRAAEDPKVVKLLNGYHPELWDVLEDLID